MSYLRMALRLMTMKMPSEDLSTMYRSVQKSVDLQI